MQFVGRMALRAPVFGWLVHDAINGLPEAKYYFAVNLAVFIAALVYFFGFPFLITAADAMAGLAIVFLIYMTAADSFSAAGRAAARDPKYRKRMPI